MSPDRPRRRWRNMVVASVARKPLPWLMHCIYVSYFYAYVTSVLYVTPISPLNPVAPRFLLKPCHMSFKLTLHADNSKLIATFHIKRKPLILRSIVNFDLFNKCNTRVICVSMCWQFKDVLCHGCCVKRGCETTVSFITRNFLTLVMPRCLHTAPSIIFWSEMFAIFFYMPTGIFMLRLYPRYFFPQNF